MLHDPEKVYTYQPDLFHSESAGMAAETLYQAIYTSTTSTTPLATCLYCGEIHRPPYTHRLAALRSHCKQTKSLHVSLTKHWQIIAYRYTLVFKWGLEINTCKIEYLFAGNIEHEITWNLLDSNISIRTNKRRSNNWELTKRQSVLEINFWNEEIKSKITVMTFNK